jgi:hypothetical protein
MLESRNFVYCTDKLALPGQRYTDFAMQQLTESLEFTQHRKVQMSDEQHGIVTSFSGGKFLMDLVACTCTWGRRHLQPELSTCRYYGVRIICTLPSPYTKPSRGRPKERGIHKGEERRRGFGNKGLGLKRCC